MDYLSGIVTYLSPGWSGIATSKRLIVITGEMDEEKSISETNDSMDSGEEYVPIKTLDVESERETSGDDDDNDTENSTGNNDDEDNDEFGGENEGDVDGNDDENEEEEEESEEPVDVKPELEEECIKSVCASHKHHYDECATRVTTQIEEKGSPLEDCVEEFFHLTHCATGCAAPKLWKRLK